MDGWPLVRFGRHRFDPGFSDAKRRDSKKSSSSGIRPSWNPG